MAASDGKYKAIIKVTEASGIPKGIINVVVRGECGRKSKDSIKAAVGASSSIATWDSDNTLVKVSLKVQPKEPAEFAVLDGIKDVSLGTCTIDLMEYVQKVPPGSKPKKFKIEKKLDKGDILLKLQVSINRDEDGDEKESKEKDKESKEKDSYTKSASRRLLDLKGHKRDSKDSSGKKRDSYDTGSSTDASSSSNIPNIVVRGGVTTSLPPQSQAASDYAAVSRSLSIDDSKHSRLSVMTDIGSDTHSQGGHTPPASPRLNTRPVNRLVQGGSSPFSSPARPSKYNTLASAAPTSHKSESAESNPSFGVSPGPTSSSTLRPQRSAAPIIRPSTPNIAQATKYPTLGNSSKGKRPGHRRGNSDVTSIDQVSDLKQRYAVERQEEDEKFLIDSLVLSETSLDPLVLAYILYQCFLKWDAFQSNPGVISRMFAAFDEALRKAEQSRSLLFVWLGAALALRSQAHADRQKNLNEEVEQIFIQFEEDLFVVAANAFDMAVRNLANRVQPLMKPAFHDALLSPAGSDRVLQEAKSGAIAAVFSILTDYVKLVQEHGIYPDVKKQFYQRLFHLTAKTLLETLESDYTSFTQGIQLKMIISQIEEWARTKVGAEFAKVAESQLEPAREAANALCFAPKSDLLKDATRKDVCPHLRPAMLASILAKYRPDSFDSEKISPKFLEDLKKLDASVPNNAPTFDPDDAAQLSFEIELTPLDFKHIQLPRLILDRPGFAFLKDGVISFQVSSNKGGDDDEKW